MVGKISFDIFNGVAPSLPNHSLPDNAASEATNVRLTDTSIRPYFEPIESIDSNAMLSTLSQGYTNFFKASHEEAIAWLAWSNPVKVSILETRYSDVSAYIYPDVPESAILGDLNVLFAGSTTVLVFSGFVAAQTFVVKSNNPPIVDPVIDQTQQVTASLEVLESPITTYAWVFQSGDAAITIDNAAIEDPTFTNPSLAAPIAFGTNTASAIWRCTITDTLASVGFKDIEIRFNYDWRDVPSGRDRCVWIGAFMPYIDSAAMAIVGGPVTILNEEQNGVVQHTINVVVFGSEEVVRLTTSSGVTLTCSVTTPLTTEDGKNDILAPAGQGHLVPVLDKGKFSWESIISVESLGVKEVARISCDGNVYAAGDQQGRFILTHNADDTGAYYKP